MKGVTGFLRFPIYKENNMATELIFAEERQNKILSMLKARNKLLVNDLCEQFSVSSATIRNDLNQLKKKDC